MRFDWAMLVGGSLAQCGIFKHFAKRGFEFFLLPSRVPPAHAQPSCRGAQDGCHHKYLKGNFNHATIPPIK